MRATFLLVTTLILSSAGWALAQGDATVKVAVSPAFAIVRAGGAHDLAITLGNPLDREVTLAMHVEGEAGPAFPVRFERPNVTLAPGASTAFRARLEVPADAPPGVHRLAIVAREEIPVASRAPTPATGRAVVELDVRPPEPPGDLVVRLDPAKQTAEAGGVASTRVTVTNTLARPVLVRLRGADPSSPLSTAWVVAFEPAEVRIAAGGVVTVAARVDVPRQANGTHHLMLGAEEVPTAKDVRPAFGMSPWTLEVRPPSAAKPEPVAAPGPSDPSPELRSAPPEASDASASAGWAVAGGAAAVGGAAGAVVLLRRRGWALPLLAPLYTRLVKAKLLEQPTRERIADAIRAEPGISFGGLQRRLGLASGVVTHHVRMLEEGGFVFSSPDGQQRRFFPVGAGRVEAVPPLPERALQLLATGGPTTASALARALGVSRQALHYHIKKLASEGRIEARSDGRDLVLTAR